MITTTYKYQRKINVEDCQDLTKEVFPHLASCTFLRSLNLSGTVIENLDFLIHGCSGSLTELKVARTPLVDFNALLSCHRLLLLDLCHTQFHDVKLLANCQRLRRLDLAGEGR